MCSRDAAPAVVCGRFAPAPCMYLSARVYPRVVLEAQGDYRLVPYARPLTRVHERDQRAGVCLVRDVSVRTRESSATSAVDVQRRASGLGSPFPGCS